MSDDIIKDYDKVLNLFDKGVTKSLEKKQKYGEDPREYLDAIEAFSKEGKREGNLENAEPNNLENNKEEKKRNIKSKPKKEKRNFKGKDIKRRIATIALATLMLIGVGSGAAKGIENSKETTEIVEMYDGNEEAIKGEIKDIIKDKFSDTLKKEVTDVEMDSNRKTARSIEYTLSIECEDGTVYKFTSNRDLDGGITEGTMPSKMTSTVEKCLGIKNAKDAAKVLNETKKTFEGKNIKQTNVLTKNGSESKIELVDDDYER